MENDIADVDVQQLLIRVAAQLNGVRSESRHDGEKLAISRQTVIARHPSGSIRADYSAHGTRLDIVGFCALLAELEIEVPGTIGMGFGVPLALAIALNDCLIGQGSAIIDDHFAGDETCRGFRTSAGRAGRGRRNFSSASALCKQSRTEKENSRG